VIVIRNLGNRRGERSTLLPGFLTAGGKKIRDPLNRRLDDSIPEPVWTVAENNNYVAPVGIITPDPPTRS
jgi:hypothetical protein